MPATRDRLLHAARAYVPRSMIRQEWAAVRDFTVNTVIKHVLPTASSWSELRNAMIVVAREALTTTHSAGS